MFNKKEYDKNNRIKITIQLNNKNDKDIIEAIDMDNKQGSIKELIRKGIKKDQVYDPSLFMKYFSLITTLLLH